jgi:hypothetical protein
MATITAETDLDELGQGEHLYLVTVVFDSSYPTGGEALDLAANRNIKRLILQPTAGYVFQWIPATQLIKVFQQTDPAAAGGANVPLVEVSNATNLASALAAVDGIAIGS